MAELPEELPVFERVGEAGIARFVASFYARVPDDPILAPMYPADDLAGAEERLRDFLVFRFGGPPRYIEQRGHPRLRMRHFPFAVDRAARDRWMELMTDAVREAELPPDVSEFVLEFFGGVATFLINRP
ncbi:MAG: globin [Planctomycetota bacterium]